MIQSYCFQIHIICYKIKTEDFFTKRKRMKKKELFDLSNTPDEFKNTTNKKIVGKMKLQTKNQNLV